MFFLRSLEKAKDWLLEFLHESRQRVVVGSNGEPFSIPHMRDLSDEACTNMSVSAHKRWERYRAEKAAVAARSNGRTEGSKKFTAS
jgi:phage FluMu protein gp41